MAEQMLASARRLIMVMALGDSVTSKLFAASSKRHEIEQESCARLGVIGNVAPEVRESVLD